MMDTETLMLVVGLIAGLGSAIVSVLGTRAMRVRRAERFEALNSDAMALLRIMAARRPAAAPVRRSARKAS
jgi:hypothetical protein